MSNFDDFDIHQMSSNFAERYYFVCNFYCKNFFIVGSLDDAENENLHFFIDHPISSLMMSITSTRHEVDRPRFQEVIIVI